MNRLIRERGRVNLDGSIFHSDGGGQYYCKEFKKITKALKMSNSMTEEKIYENSHAERLNGIIKNNYLYPYGPKNMKDLKRLLNKAIRMYNTEKPHKALGRMTPEMFRKTIDKENNSASYFPLSTVNNNQVKRRKISVKSVNVI